MTGDALYSYTFNGANEITGANGVNYMYDGDGPRVEKSSGTLFWRAYTGQVIEETNTSGGMERDYIFFAGRRIAWKDSSGNVYYYFVDAIGSTRAVTDFSGNVCFSADYYPYGRENDYNTSCSPTYKFTGYESDSETGNYYAYARYYNPRLGRFMSPDPLGGSAGDPQSMNGYSYVLNNPTTLNDPLGLVAVCLVAGRADVAGGGNNSLPSCGDGPTEGGGTWGGGGGGNDYYWGGGNCYVDGGDVPCGALGLLAPPDSVYSVIECWDSAGCAAGMLDAINGQSIEGGAGFWWPGLAYPLALGIGGDQTAPQAPGQTKMCDVSARVLQGNPAKVGFQGGIPGAKVQAGSAAVVPSEFGVGSGAGLAPYALQISGYFPGMGVSFQGATDVIGGPPPMGFNNIRYYLEFINPGQVIIELPTGPEPGRVPAIINVPAGSPCPAAPPFITDPVTGPTVG